MNITFEEEKDDRVRADTLKVGDGFRDEDSVYLIIRRNSANFNLNLKRGSTLRPSIVVVNLTFDCLGHVRKGKMVTPVELKLTVGRKNV